MSELQNDESVIDNDDYVEVETEEVAEAEEPSDLAPDSDGQHEEKADPDSDERVNQEAINARFNKKHREVMEAKREAEELRKRLEQYESQNQNPPAVPELRDYLDFDSDEEYRRHIREREEAIGRRKQWEFEQNYLSQQQQQAQWEQQQRQQEELARKASTYFERAKKYNMDTQELQSLGSTVASYGVSDEVAGYILDDDKGPLITKHLVANPAELEKVASMRPIDAVLYIERHVKSKAEQLRPKSSNAPPPAKRVDGGSFEIDEGRYPHLGGATIE